MKKIYSIAIFGLIGLFSTSFSPKELQLLSVEQLTEEYMLVINSLETVHPNLFKYQTVAEWELAKKTILSKLNKPISASDFHILIRQLLVSVKCGHLVAKPSKEWYQNQIKNSSLPSFNVFIDQNELYIKEIFIKELVTIVGNKIISIDGKEAKTVISELKSIQQRDGTHSSFVDFSIQKYFRTYSSFMYNEQSQFNLVVSINKDGKLLTSQIKKGIAQTEFSTFPYDENNCSVLKRINQSYFYIRKNDNSFAELDLNSFPSKDFKKFYKSTFATLSDKKITNLILDLRGNGGGYFPNGIALLEYLLPEEFEFNFSKTKVKPFKSEYLSMNTMSKLTKKSFGLMPDTDKLDPHRNYQLKGKPQKKNRFEGQLYVLIDGGSFSMSSFVASKLKNTTNAIFIGTETGGGQLGSNAILNYQLILPYSGIELFIPNYFLNHNSSNQSYTRGIIPHYAVDYKIDEILKNIDKELIKALELINNKP